MSAETPEPTRLDRLGHELMIVTSVQGYCRCGDWGMASDGGLERLRDLHAEHVLRATGPDDTREGA